MKSTILVATLAVLLSACTSLGRLGKNATMDSNGESVFVLGVAPKNFRVSIFSGSVDNGRFRQNPFLPAKFYGAARNGYVVGEASAGDTLAITNVRVVAGKYSIFGENFAPCLDAKTMTFKIPGGKILYLGNVKYEFVGRRLKIQYSRDIDSARKYIHEHYPDLRRPLEPWKYRLLPTAAACRTTLYIPVYTRR